jgi:hypothetical protein
MRLVVHRKLSVGATPGGARVLRLTLPQATIVLDLLDPV